MYANLAVRGRTVPEIVAEQVPAAVALKPDLVSFAGGINDALRRDWDLVTMAQSLQRGMAELAQTGAQIVIVTYGRPSRRSRFMAVVEGRLQQYREVTYEVAAVHGATVVDFWEETVFDDPRFWSDDRLHLNSLGHERVSMAVLDALGMPAPHWREPLPCRSRPLGACGRRSLMVRAALRSVDRAQGKRSQLRRRHHGQTAAVFPGGSAIRACLTRPQRIVGTV